ncbi:hypothetical protein V1514DRAFT_318741 [Lipomyces japonicus]|uniref:uncharacterized protein n=1 Tax=Lipomyces japonicus TaxID=56871 RepID=UPI0034CF5FB5
MTAGVTNLKRKNFLTKKFNFQSTSITTTAISDRDIMNALPQANELRTSLILPALTARFSILMDPLLAAGVDHDHEHNNNNDHASVSVRLHKPPEYANPIVHILHQLSMPSKASAVLNGHDGWSAPSHQQQPPPALSSPPPPPPQAQASSLQTFKETSPSVLIKPNYSKRRPVSCVHETEPLPHLLALPFQDVFEKQAKQHDPGQDCDISDEQETVQYHLSNWSELIGSTAEQRRSSLRTNSTNSSSASSVSTIAWSPGHRRIKAWPAHDELQVPVPEIPVKNPLRQICNSAQKSDAVDMVAKPISDTKVSNSTTITQHQQLIPRASLQSSLSLSSLSSTIKVPMLGSTRSKPPLTATSSGSPYKKIQPSDISLPVLIGSSNVDP